MTVSHPLKWPEGWARYTGWRTAAHQFKSPFGRSLDRLYDHLTALKAKDVVISSNLELTMRGQPRADKARMKLADPGVAVYFTRGGKQLVMARDKFDSAGDNMHSLMLALEGLRQLERHGGGTLLERAFDGFMALPEQSNWRSVLGFTAGETITLAQAELRYREGAKKCHADAGGGHEAMIKLNAAIGHARKELA